MPEPIAGRHLHRHRRLRQALRDLPRPLRQRVNFRGFPHIPGNDFVVSYAMPGEPGNDGRPSARACNPDDPDDSIVSHPRRHRRRGAGLDRHAYRHQASLKGVGCDCLGLVRGVWRALHGAEPERAPAYRAGLGRGVGERNARAGGAARILMPIDARRIRGRRRAAVPLARPASSPSTPRSSPRPTHDGARP